MSTLTLSVKAVFRVSRFARSASSEQPELEAPDRKWVAVASHMPETDGHQANTDALLRLMPAEGDNAKTLAESFGGRGSMESPSRSTDSKQIAFVSYRMVSG